MLILTASNKDFREIGDLNEVSLQRYCKAHPHHSHIRWEIPMAYAMPPSWFKLDMILYHLELGNPFVMWTDADTLWVGDRDIPLMEHCDLQICQDCNGINCGVMVWRHSNLVMDFLRRINAMTEYFGHPWWEQKAIMDHLSELTVGYMEKAVWNAYPVPVPNADAGPESVILHFPAVKNRREVMETYAEYPEILKGDGGINPDWLTAKGRVYLANTRLPTSDEMPVLRENLKQDVSVPMDENTIESKITEEHHPIPPETTAAASEPVPAVVTLETPQNALEAVSVAPEAILEGKEPSQ